MLQGNSTTEEFPWWDLRPHWGDVVGAFAGALFGFLAAVAFYLLTQWWFERKVAARRRTMLLRNLYFEVASNAAYANRWPGLVDALLAAVAAHRMEGQLATYVPGAFSLDAYQAARTDPDADLAADRELEGPLHQLEGLVAMARNTEIAIIRELSRDPPAGDAAFHLLRIMASNSELFVRLSDRVLNRLKELGYEAPPYVLPAESGEERPTPTPPEA